MLAVRPHQQCSCRSLPSRAVFLLLQSACAVTASPCGPACHLCRYRPQCSVSPPHPRPSRSVRLSPLLIHIFCISHLLSTTSPSVRPRGRPLVLAFMPRVLLPRDRKKKEKSKGRERKKNSVLLEADGGWMTLSTGTQRSKSRCRKLTDNIDWVGLRSAPSPTHSMNSDLLCF